MSDKTDWPLVLFGIFMVFVLGWFILHMTLSTFVDGRLVALVGASEVMVISLIAGLWVWWRCLRGERS